MIYQGGFLVEHDKSVSTVNIYRPPLCLAGEDLPEPATMSFLGGEISIFTCSSPMAGHDNEDTLMMNAFVPILCLIFAKPGLVHGKWDNL